MVTLLEINKAVNDKIKASLASTEFYTVKLLSEDISEPIIRPSIKITIENGTNGKFNARNREKTLTIRVYFFASNRYKYKIENAKMQDILENAFLDDLQVREGFFIPIQEVESEIVDKVLVCSFELYVLELLPEMNVNEIGEPLEVIENLNIKLKKG